MKRSLIAVALALVLPSVAGATTWYVGPSGSNGYTCAQAQNPATPKLTIEAGLACVGLATGAGAGHTVQVASGTYAETIWSWPSGAPDLPFVLRSATQYGAVIQPGLSTRIFDISASYLTIDGFVLDGSHVNGNNIVLNEGTTDITFQNNDIRNTQVGDGTGPGSFQAILGYQTSRASFLNNQIHDIGVGATAHFNHAIYWVSSDSLIDGNTIYNVGGNAIQVYSSSGMPIGGNIIRNNTLYDFAQGGVGNGVFTAGDHDLVYNNLIYQTRTNGSAVGVTLDGSGTQAYHNTVYNNGYIGLSVAGSNSIARNNITFRNGIDVLTGGSNPVTDHNLTADPRFVSLVTFDFRLAEASPAINAAMTLALVATDINGRPRPQGGASDLGAVEYGDELLLQPVSGLELLSQ
jgi:hypothetical protein